MPSCPSHSHKGDHYHHYKEDENVDIPVKDPDPDPDVYPYVILEEFVVPEISTDYSLRHKIFEEVYGVKMQYKPYLRPEMILQVETDSTEDVQNKKFQKERNTSCSSPYDSDYTEYANSDSNYEEDSDSPRLSLLRSYGQKEIMKMKALNNLKESNDRRLRSKRVRRVRNKRVRRKIDYNQKDNVKIRSNEETEKIEDSDPSTDSSDETKYEMSLLEGTTTTTFSREDYNNPLNSKENNMRTDSVKTSFDDELSHTKKIMRYKGQLSYMDKDTNQKMRKERTITSSWANNSTTPSDACFVDTRSTFNNEREIVDESSSDVVECFRRLKVSGTGSNQEDNHINGVSDTGDQDWNASVVDKIQMETDDQNWNNLLGNNIAPKKTDRRTKTLEKRRRSLKNSLRFERELIKMKRRIKKMVKPLNKFLKRQKRRRQR